MSSQTLGTALGDWTADRAGLGDFLDKPTADGGLALSRYVASAALLAVIAITLVAIPHRAGRHPGDLQPPQEG